MVSAKVSDASYNYFHPFQYPNKRESNVAKKIGLTSLKVTSYITVAVPLVMLFVHARSSALAGRAYKFPLLHEDRNLNFQATVETRTHSYRENPNNQIQSTETLRPTNTIDTQIIQSYVGPTTRVKVIPPFEIEDASNAFHNRSSALSEITFRFCGWDRISPNPQVISTLCEYPDFHLLFPDEYDAILQGVIHSFYENPGILLEYVEANLEDFTKMFEGKPFPLNMNKNWFSMEQLSEEQVRLLELLPITTLCFKGEFEDIKLFNMHEISSFNPGRFKQLLGVIPKMEKLRVVDAINSRFLPKKFYEVFEKVTDLSIRIEQNNVKELKNLPNIIKLSIRFENTGQYRNVTQVLLNATKLEELTFFGDRTPSEGSFSGCLQNVPDWCKILRLHMAHFSVEEIVENFRFRPLDTLYFRNNGYSETEINRLKDAGVAYKIVIENGGC